MLSTIIDYNIRDGIFLVTDLIVALGVELQIEKMSIHITWSFGLY